MRQVDPPLVTGDVAEVEGEGLPALQLHGTGGEAADPQLRTLQVHEHADRVVQFRFHLAHPGEALRVIGVVAVAEVQAEQVGAGLHQGTDIVAAAGGRAEGGEDLGFLVGCHVRTRG